MADVLADYEEAKKKVEEYEHTWWEIAQKGVRLGDILNEDMTGSRNVLHLLDNLEMLAQQRAFCCGGWIEMSQTDAHSRLKMKEDTTNQLGWRITDLPVDSLLEFCTPSPYGDLKKRETVYDPSVRLASECEASKFQFAKKTHKPKTGDKRKRTPSSQSLVNCRLQFLDVIREKVSSTLANGKDVALECYKLNVYGKGGFFNAHVDTPVDPARMIGTVVVCLPCQHTGGVLTVKHKEVKKEFPFANLSGDGEKIQWAAFYSDCVHEILPVEDGNRITITYNIIKQSTACVAWGHWCKNQSFSKGPMVAADNTAVIDNIASDVVKVASDGAVAVDRGHLKHFGIFLQHRYTMPALAAGNLKGCDQLLYDGLTSRGVTCHPLTVLVHEVERETEDDLDGENQRDVFLFSQEDMDYVNKNCPKPSQTPWREVPFIKDWSKEHLLISEEQTEGEYCGNWTEGDEVELLYLQSALIIDIHP